MFRNLANAALIAFVTAFNSGFSSTGSYDYKGDTEVDALNASLLSKQTELQAAVADQVEAQASARSKTEVVNGLRNDIMQILAQLQLYAKAKQLPASIMELLGFGGSSTGRTSVIPSTPTELSATGYSNGVNAVSWNRANNGYGVSFIVEAKSGNGGWNIIGVTKRQRFTHSGQTPGETIMYRVQAQSASGSSEYSDTAVIYG